VEQLKETEEIFYKIINSAAPPYSLFYSTAIETKNINYQKETADLNINIYLFANLEWFNAMQRALKAAKAVMDGLNATNRRKEWGLDKWPEQGRMSNANPFASRKEYDIPIEFELVNQKGKVIGRQVAKLNPFFSINSNFTIRFTPNSSSILTFKAVNANDISDNLTIRLASVNLASPETARFPISAISTKEPPDIIKRISFIDSRNGIRYEAVEIGSQTWMAENLNYNVSGSKCYKNDPANCDKYGKLYDWETAMKVCPEGWHLPSKKEWEILADFTKYRSLKAKRGWGERYNGTDDFGFKALPGGDGRSNGSFSNIGAGGFFWSASEYNSKTAYFKKNEEEIWNSVDKSYLFSVRCLQDDETMKEAKQTNTFTDTKEDAQIVARTTVSVLTDNRDGKKYNTVKIGNLVWMAENLNYDAKSTNKIEAN